MPDLPEKLKLANDEAKVAWMMTHLGHFCTQSLGRFRFLSIDLDNGIMARIGGSQ